MDLSKSAAIKSTLPVANGGTGLTAVASAGQGYVSNGTINVLNPLNTRNFLINGAFDLWQRGTSLTIANGANTNATIYLADRWYVKNSLGTNGVITFSQQTGGVNGSTYGAKVLITSVPTAGQTNGTELYQTIDNPTSMMLYGQTASFNASVKAFGNVNQVGCQFFYKTSEARVDTSIGSEQTVAVTTGGFANCTINGQALGTTQTTSGVIGIRVRITGVSTGNTYDASNGFQVEQASVNLGSVAFPFQRAGNTIGGELNLAQRYYEKSYDLTVAPGTSSNAAGSVGFATPESTQTSIYIPFKVTKRISAGAGTIYSTNTGTSGKAYNVTGGVDVTATAANVGMNGMITNPTETDGNQITFHWILDADI